MSKMPPVSDWTLERYALKELPAEETTALTERLAHDAELAARLKEIEDSNAAILAAHPPAEMAAAIKRKVHIAETHARHQKRSSGWNLIVTLAPALSVILLATFLFLPNVGPFFGIQDEVTRFKGLEPRVVLYRQAPAGAEALAAEAAVRAGDVLQVAYVAAGKKYGVVVSVDGNSSVTMHLPSAEGDRAAVLDASGEVPLAHAYELDAAPAFERFFLVTADKPFDARTVVAAARKLAADLKQAPTQPLALPQGLQQTSVLLRKR